MREQSRERANRKRLINYYLFYIYFFIYCGFNDGTPSPCSPVPLLPFGHCSTKFKWRDGGGIQNTIQITIPHPHNLVMTKRKPTQHSCAGSRLLTLCYTIPNHFALNISASCIDQKGPYAGMLLMLPKCEFHCIAVTLPLCFIRYHTCILLTPF